jgi:hypothetical protein
MAAPEQWDRRTRTLLPLLTPTQAHRLARESQAVRGALVGAALSVPLWAAAFALAYWLIG